MYKVLCSHLPPVTQMKCEVLHLSQNFKIFYC